jgi:hypothetical protein
MGSMRLRELVRLWNHFLSPFEGSVGLQQLLTFKEMRQLPLRTPFVAVCAQLVQKAGNVRDMSASIMISTQARGWAGTKGEIEIAVG